MKREKCQKVVHTSAKAARKFHGERRYGCRVRAYYCKTCRGWHCTTQGSRYGIRTWDWDEGE